MSDHVEPTHGPGRRANSVALAATMRHAYADWVVPNDTDILSYKLSTVSDGPHNAFYFAQNAGGTTGLDVTIGSGEAFVKGAYLCRDEQTSGTVVTLAANTNNQTVYVGHDDQSTDALIIGLASDFPTDAPKMAIHEFDTDGSTYTSHTDLRTMSPRVPEADWAAEADSATVADSANKLGGVNAGNYARTDTDETFNGDITIDKESATVQVGTGGGPHVLKYGSIDSEGLQLSYATTPHNWNVQSYAGDNKLTVPLSGPVVTADGIDVNAKNVDGVNNLIFGGDDYHTVNSPNLSGWTINFIDIFNNRDPVLTLHEGGDVDVPNGNLTEQGNNVVSSNSGDYEIQKNGTDGSGVINFKTQ